MGSLDEGGIGSPSSGFERSGVEEAVVQCDESLSDSIGNFVEVTGAQLVRYQTIRTLVSVRV